jgi:hypothetical protein
VNGGVDGRRPLGLRPKRPLDLRPSVPMAYCRSTICAEIGPAPVAEMMET